MRWQDPPHSQLHTPLKVRASAVIDVVLSPYDDSCVFHHMHGGGFTCRNSLLFDGGPRHGA